MMILKILTGPHSLLENYQRPSSPHAMQPRTLPICLSSTIQTQTQGPEFDPQNPCRNLDVGAWVCNHSVGEIAQGPARLSKSTISRYRRRHHLKNWGGQQLRKILLSTSGAYMHTWTHTSTQICKEWQEGRECGTDRQTSHLCSRQCWGLSRQHAHTRSV